MGWLSTVRLLRSRDAPAAARTFVSEQLNDELGGSSAARRAIDDAQLVVSELVTNAVTARCHEVEVRLLLERERLEIWVWDDGRGAPAMREAGIYDTTGRGLIIVSALAQQWAVESAPDGSKWVWARLSLPKPVQVRTAETMSAR